ncbi:hypothetical protein AOLI_G00136580 [Acnodon oligacanthus]
MGVPIHLTSRSSPVYRHLSSHLRHLEEVLQCLHHHGLNLEPKKCRLFQRQVTYLGHVISELGVAMDPAKRAAVKYWPVPQTVKQAVHRCQTGWPGAVLAQVQGDQERVIAYANRSLQPTERNDQNYSSFKLELLALKWAVSGKFKDYLYGTEFTVFTDNNPLLHLNMARLGAVEQRWVSRMANFKYTVKYRPGTQNRNADALSRLLNPQELMPANADHVVVEE